MHIHGWAGRRKLGFGAAIGSALVFAGPVPMAGAWTASSDAGVLQVTAAVAEANAFAVSDGDPGTFVVSDDVNAFTGSVPAGCTAIDDGSGAPVTGLSCDSAMLQSVVVDAGDGADTLDVASAQVVVSGDGGDGADAFTGGDGAERFGGGPGDDVLDGGGGADVVAGGPGSDEVLGGGGDDVVSGESDADRLDGGDGNDTVAGGDGADAVAGGAGDDVLRGEDGDDQLTGDEGVDRLEGGSGSDDVDGGLGDDVGSGGAGPDVLDAGDGRDTMAGDDGDDTLNAGPAGSTLLGGEGADRLQGAAGADVLDGGGGPDSLLGEEGSDALNGGDGDDVLDGGGGSDRLQGGAGGDRVTYETAAGDVVVTIGRQGDDGTVGEGDDVAADVEAVEGGLGNDRLTAGTGAATLLGSDGQDVLVGGPSADRIDGGPGEDRLDGGFGADVLSGGAEVDTVSYAARRKSVRVDLAAGRPDGGQRGEGDLVQTDVETVVGGSGDDVLRGARGVANTLAGGPGDDFLFDRANRDAVADEARCGSGTDRTHGDGGDLVGSDCENVWVDRARTRYGTSPAGRPSTYLTGRPLRGGRRGPVRVRLRCQKRTPRACRVSVTLTKRGRILGRARAALSPGLTRDVRVALTPEGRRRLARYPASTLLRVRVDVRAGAGRGVPVLASLPIGTRR